MQFVRWRTWILYAGVGLLAAIAATGVWMSRNWPFTRNAITRDLQQNLQGRVVIGKFRETWFPPGCVASDIRVLHDASKTPAITARDLIVQSSWHGLPSRQISRLKVIGLHVIAPSAGGSFKSAFIRDGNSQSRFSTINEVEVNEAVLERVPHDEATNLDTVHLNQLILNRLGSGHLTHFRATLRTSKPAGQLNVQGDAGPWNSKNPRATPVSGAYQYADGDLHVFKDLKGILSSEGKFHGDLSIIHTGGKVDVPQFHVDRSAHSVHLTALYQAAVNTQNADTMLEQVEAHVGKTTILAKGSVAGSEGKTARVELTVNTGRLEDLLNYFSEEKNPSMTGAVRLRALAELPPGRGFLGKLRLTGDFGVAGGKFTRASRQAPVDALSESAREKAQHETKAAQEDERTALENLRGHVVVRDGIATLSNVGFDFPGAAAAMAGTFQLIQKTVDIHGTLRTTGTISEASSGFKALMLKVATPFMKKQKTTVVPFAITGTSSNPKIGLDLKHRSSEPRP
jgi:hypothetical protein